MPDNLIEGILLFGWWSTRSAASTDRFGIGKLLRAFPADVDDKLAGSSSMWRFAFADLIDAPS